MAGCKECCGTCEHNSYDNGEFTCGNPDSEVYGLSIQYGDNCEDWEEK